MSEYFFPIFGELEQKLEQLINADENHVSDAFEKVAIDLQETAFRLSVMARMLRDRPVKAVNEYDGEFHQVTLETDDDEAIQILDNCVKGGLVHSNDDELYCQDYDHPNDCGCE
jgi:hypothetical protein